MKYLTLIIFLVLFQITLVWCEDKLEIECRLNGLTPDLLCSSCKVLPSFNLDVLTEDCNKCCIDNLDDDEDIANVSIGYLLPRKIILCGGNNVQFLCHFIVLFTSGQMKVIMFNMTL